MTAAKTPDRIWLIPGPDGDTVWRDDPAPEMDPSDAVEYVRADLRTVDHRSFPEAADGRPLPPMGDELMTAGLSGDDARFVALQLAQNGLMLVPACRKCGGAMRPSETVEEALTGEQWAAAVNAMTHIFRRDMDVTRCPGVATCKDALDAALRALKGGDATPTAQEAVPVSEIVERKFYHSEWKLTNLLAARHGGLVTDGGEAWSYRYSHKDGTGGKYDLLFRREPTAHPPQPSVSVAVALKELLQAVCGETGFAACVRQDSGRAYPWPALDAAEAKAQAALRALKGDK